MEAIMKSFLAFAVFIVLIFAGAAAPVEQLPVLKDQPAEVLFKADNYSTVLLECAMENNEKDVQYKWHKNGAPFDWQAAGHIGQRQGDGSIMFFNPQPSDEAVYQCFAETSFGVASTRPISLKQTYINHPRVQTREHNPTLLRPYKLDCVIPDAYPKPTIVWKSQSISNSSESETILSRRLTISPDGNLWFSNIANEDVRPNHKYVCVAQTPAVKGDVVLAEHIIKSAVEDSKPNDGELVQKYMSLDMVAKIGDVTHIYCIYGGSPVLPICLKDGKDANGEPGDRITHHNGTWGKRLLIKEALLDEQGAYTCEIYYGIDKPQKHSMVLTVVSAPKFAKKPEKQIKVKAGEDVSIPCEITGLPEPKVTWTKNAQPLDGAAVKVGVLTIKQAKKSDTGYYGCKAVNEHGDLYAETLVRVE